MSMKNNSQLAILIHTWVYWLLWQKNKLEWITSVSGYPSSPLEYQWNKKQFSIPVSTLNLHDSLGKTLFCTQFQYASLDDAHTFEVFYELCWMTWVVDISSCSPKYMDQLSSTCLSLYKTYIKHTSSPPKNNNSLTVKM